MHEADSQLLPVACFWRRLFSFFLLLLLFSSSSLLDVNVALRLLLLRLLDPFAILVLASSSPFTSTIFDIVSLRGHGCPCDMFTKQSSEQKSISR